MATRNPWLDIRASDYLGHMSSPQVDQLSVLSRLFGEALDSFRPADVLLLGCSTGNGLIHIDPSVTRRVTGVDINPEYLARLEKQFPSHGFDLRLECEDVMTMVFAPAAFDLVHCGLIFEYVEWPRLLPALGRALRTGGGLSVVLQRPSVSSEAVTRTPYPSLLDLERVFHFVDPSALTDEARSAGLELQLQRNEPLPSGKAFEVMYFRKITHSSRKA